MQNSEKLVGWQMIKLLARLTNNAEKISWKRRIFKCKRFKEFFTGLQKIFGFHCFNLSSFVVCINVVE